MPSVESLEIEANGSEDQKIEEEPNKPVVGIIYPPPEVRSILWKPYSYLDYNIWHIFSAVFLNIWIRARVLYYSRKAWRLLFSGTLSI